MDRRGQRKGGGTRAGENGATVNRTCRRRSGSGERGGEFDLGDGERMPSGWVGRSIWETRWLRAAELGFLERRSTVGLVGDGRLRFVQLGDPRGGGSSRLIGQLSQRLNFQKWGLL